MSTYRPGSFLLAVLVSLAAACGPDDEVVPDAGLPDEEPADAGTRDAGAPDAGPHAGKPDAGGSADAGFTCPPSLHACDGRCVRDESPATCGARCEPCPAPPDGRATCAGGRCGFTCFGAEKPCGEACLDCAASPDGRACFPGGSACGCTSTDDCPSGRVCDPAAKRCIARCTGTSCGTGCCRRDGLCSNGDVPEGCGHGGYCSECSGYGAGGKCLAGSCGCEATGDCEGARACDLGTRRCTSACSLTQPCAGGCCASGRCESGYQDTACGPRGGACSDCAASPLGKNCTSDANGYHCGCSSLRDCPLGTACDFDSDTCSTTCAPPAEGWAVCNGGCCDPATRRCVTGTDPAACGWGGGRCDSCAINACGAGPKCIPYRDAGVCGCESVADCTDGWCGEGAQCMNAHGIGHDVCCAPAGAPCATASICCSGFCAGFSGRTTCQ